ncbi:hypothetical protein DAY19_02830 [Halobacteriovorax vibrionivorans]|uniref:Lipoprotein n=1 Tax=Halobacteriovorax vibrionivorans TaxID=2152716 RepID=A0ABY0IID9_9BACT|nr:hypothetical protein [Halobacteriovorax vibrionivorans]RZF22724.1 hypothetical protein DAY19_02830 [Halobacteriovorax vibrionivorans]
MYKSKRTRRNSQLYRKAGLCALACFTLISCATPKKTSTSTKASTDKVTAHKLLSSGLCKEFKGRGRLNFGKKQERFTYNAIFNKETFSLAIDVPFKGQETLILPLATGKKVEGTLYKKISKNLVAANHLRTKNILDNFLMQNRLLFSDIRNVDSNYCDDKCLPGKVTHFSDGKLVYSKQMSGPFEFKAEFSRLVANEYKVIQLHGLRKLKNSQKKQRVLALDLIVDSCGSI